MQWEPIASVLTFIAVLALNIWFFTRKSKRYGSHTDPVKIRASLVRGRGFLRNKHPEDSLYTDDGRINRDWKP